MLISNQCRNHSIAHSRSYFTLFIYFSLRVDVNLQEEIRSFVEKEGTRKHYFEMFSGPRNADNLILNFVQN